VVGREPGDLEHTLHASPDALNDPLLGLAVDGLGELREEGVRREGPPLMERLRPTPRQQRREDRVQGVGHLDLAGVAVLGGPADLLCDVDPLPGEVEAFPLERHGLADTEALQPHHRERREHVGRDLTGDGEEAGELRLIERG